MHLHLRDQLLGSDDAATERSLSVPPGSSSSYWEVPLEGLFSPPMPSATPETPYSSCSSLSTSHYEGSLSSFKTEPHQQQYENGELLMHGMPGKPPSKFLSGRESRLMNAAVQYPYYIPTTHERTLEIQPQLNYLPNHAHSHPHSHGHGHEDHILGLRPNMIIPPPYHGQSMIPVHHHQPYALDGIVM